MGGYPFGGPFEVILFCLGYKRVPLFWEIPTCRQHIAFFICCETTLDHAFFIFCDSNFQNRFLYDIMFHKEVYDISNRYACTIYIYIHIHIFYILQDPSWVWGAVSARPISMWAVF